VTPAGISCKKSEEFGSKKKIPTEMNQSGNFHQRVNFDLY